MLLMTRRPRVHLTGRELEVVDLLCDGLTSKEIAARLEISYWTVCAHVANARTRTKSATNEQLVARFRHRRRRDIDRVFA